eukprot:3924747-Pyramimonas_sp.AAC.1
MARRQCGAFWKARTSKTIKKMMFEAFVTGAAYSGMVVFVLPPSLIKVIDPTLAKLLRCLAEGDLSWTDEKRGNKMQHKQRSI